MAFATFDGADHVIFTPEDLTADLVDVGSGEPEPPVHLVRSSVAGILSGALDEEVIADNLASLVAESLFAVYWSPLDGYGVSVAVDGTFTFAVTSASNARESGVVSVSTGR